MSDESRLALKPGTEIDGYRIDSVLGTGGFGTTYRATEVMLDRVVAIKEFLPSGIATRDQDGLRVEPLTRQAAEDYAWGMDRFRSEAQTLVAFKHPNIVGVHRYFEAHNTGYLVMAFVEGKTLSELLFPDKTLDESEIHEVLDPLLGGLRAVHDQGFLHRDIKPANIFIGEDGTPVLIDFGAARQALGQHSKSLTAIISEGYAPYEQYDQSGDQGAWTDIYALGGVLYRCVTGLRPPDAPGRVTAIVRGRPDPLKPAADAAKGTYSAALLGAINKSLATREDDRPQSIAELRALIAPSGVVASAVATTLDDANETLYPGQSPVSPASLAAAAASKPPAPPSTPPLGGGAGGRPPRSGGVNWRILAPAAALVLGGAVGAWALIGQGESAACREHAQAASAAIDRRDATAATKSVGDAAAAGCSGDMLSNLGRKLTKLSAELRAEAARKKAEEEAERKRQEAARKKAEEEAERKRQEAARKKAEEEAERKRQEAARKKAEEEAERKRQEAARKKAEEEAERKRQEAARKKAEEEAARRKQATVGPFVSFCQNELRAYLHKDVTKKFDASARKNILKAAGSACQCLGDRTYDSGEISDRDKKRVWERSKFDFSTDGMSNASAAAYEKIYLSCSAPMGRLIRAAQKKAAEKAARRKQANVEMPPAAQKFVKACHNQMEKRMGKQAARLEKLGKELKDRVMGAARGMCTCVAKEMIASSGISAEDKAKVWAGYEFKPSSKPNISEASKKAFQEIGKKCAGKMIAVLGEVMKKAQEKMKKK